MRVDLLMVEQGLAASRRQAQDLIAGGHVYIHFGAERKQVKKASETVKEVNGVHPRIEVVSYEEFRYVSRAGLKLEGALRHTGLSVEGKTALDVGISTGGFTDCLLQGGAPLVVGVDVGHGQLSPKLVADSRVHLIEGVNARGLSSYDLLRFTSAQKFDLVVVDVSFISLALVLPEVIKYLKNEGYLLALVKPQFEVGREGLGKGGIVKDPHRLVEVREKIISLCQGLDLKVEDYFASSIEGADGNKEFFVFAHHDR